MERRTFLQGLFGGVTAAGLIVAAAPNEIEAFAAPLEKGTPITLHQPPMVVAPRASAIFMRHGFDEFLYNSRGERVAIISDLHVRQNHIDFDSAYGPLSVPGLCRIEMNAVSIGRVEVTDTGIELRGDR